MSDVSQTGAQRDALSRLIPDLIRSRGLLWDLISKDFRARYRNASIGVVWAVLHPLLMSLVLWMVFGIFLKWKMEERGIVTECPFVVHLLSGLVPWQFMAVALTTATGSLVTNRGLITKVYFPRETIPLASIGSCFVSFGIGFAVLIAVRLFTGGSIGVGLVWILPVFLLQVVLLIGLALLLSCVNVYFRDVFYMVEVLMALGFYATPIFYTLKRVEDAGAEWPWLARLYPINPMVGIVTAYRQAFLDNRFPDLDLFIWPVIWAVAALVLGAVVFRRKSPVIADSV